MRLKLKNPLIPLYFVSFIISMQYALVVYVNSSFLKSITGESSFGAIFALASVLSIVVLLEIPRLLNRIGNYKTMLGFIILNSLSLFVLGYSKNANIVVLFFLLYNIANYAILFSQDIFIEDYTQSGGSIGRARGIVLTAMNLAFVFAPSLSGYLVIQNLEGISYSRIYIFAALFTIPAIFFIFPWFKRFQDPKYRKILVTDTIKKMVFDMNLRKIYISEFLLRFFFSWMIIYTPIYLHEIIGFDWKEIGFIFTVMLLPFVLVEYPLGEMSDIIGEKKILFFGFLLMSLSTLGIFFLHSSNIFIWAAILFFTRLGAASVEVMNESYFFKKIKARDSGLISFYRNAYPFAIIIAPIVATPILSLLGYQYVFLILGMIVFLGLLNAIRLKDIK